MDTCASVAEVLPFHPSPVDYERIALLLARLGVRFSGVKLRAIDFAGLVWLAGQGPGIFHHQATIGEALGLSKDATHDMLNRLRNIPGSEGYGVPFVYSERVKIRTKLPGMVRPTQTKTNRYWLTGKLRDLLQAEDDHRARVAAAKRGELELAPPPPTPAPASSERRPDLSWAEPEIQALAAAFDALELPTRSGKARRALARSELQALRNRVAEGCALDELQAALAGASETVWQRTDGQAWALDPFAVVFASVDTVRRFATKGREAIAERAPRTSTAIAAAPSTAEEPSSMTALQPSSTGSVGSPDRDPTSKTSTSGPPEPRSEARGLRPPEWQARPHDATATAARAPASTAAPNGPPRPSEDERQRTKEEQNRDHGSNVLRVGEWETVTARLEEIFPGFRGCSRPSNEPLDRKAPRRR